MKLTMQLLKQYLSKLEEEQHIIEEARKVVREKITITEGLINAFEDSRTRSIAEAGFDVGAAVSNPTGDIKL